MTRIKIKKCQYGKHCKHGGNINPEEEQYCLDGKKYYHPDCKKEKDTILEIIDFWYRNIDDKPIFNQLRRIIDRLVYQDGYEAEYILFALKKKMSVLHHPPGLVYAVKDAGVARAWDKARKENEAEEVKVVIKPDTSFNFSAQKNTKFSDIFGG